ncbi:TetR/AcrR family transcriptional regulator [Clostridium luticellarii]|uniref:TetR/AcrR family transcriptional regulator n=1 Tax=Clostridium luticellarii TaxID=1691940 RepID=UPI0023572BDB|nr:TetR/AcrR family transcriptional regulator [Clostridium luticellarii]MCI1969470.1 TetR/AcrR family transcriptional regulator [Clostridium luticellarii]MCI1996786.1 TetR/AcrR family transcriptional regulator [Clostridium luticellarii]MCI2039637.1 TetR/AcrR family transcriptional regulator [Clostridium luticellarii]
MNKSNTTKELLIKTVIELLQECTDISEITSRKITKRANVNLSTINYYFNSKDELVNIAINKLIGDTADIYFKNMANSSSSPKDKLRNFLISLSDMVVNYEKYTKQIIPYILLKEKFTETMEILPLVKGCFEETKSDKKYRVISYQLISFMQLVFYRADEFKSFSKIDIMNKKERDALIDMEMNLLIK